MDNDTQQHIDKKIDKLAVIVQQGFTEMNDKYTGLKQDMGEMKQDMGEMKQDMDKKHNEIMNSNDKVVQMLTRREHEDAAVKMITDKHEENIEEHEIAIKDHSRRLRSVEAAV